MEKLVNTVTAILIQDIVFHDLRGDVIYLERGTAIILDPNRCVACAGDYHFTVERWEYKILS